LEDSDAHSLTDPGDEKNLPCQLRIHEAVEQASARPQNMRTLDKKGAKEPSCARMATSEGVRAAHAGSTPWSRTCVSYLGFILCCLSRLSLVG